MSYSEANRELEADELDKKAKKVISWVRKGYVCALLKEGYTFAVIEPVGNRDSKEGVAISKMDLEDKDVLLMGLALGKKYVVENRRKAIGTIRPVFMDPPHKDSDNGTRILSTDSLGSEMYVMLRHLTGGFDLILERRGRLFAWVYPCLHHKQERYLEKEAFYVSVYKMCKNPDDRWKFLRYLFSGDDVLLIVSRRVLEDNKLLGYATVEIPLEIKDIYRRLCAGDYGKPMSLYEDVKVYGLYEPEEALGIMIRISGAMHEAGEIYSSINTLDPRCVFITKDGDIDIGGSLDEDNVCFKAPESDAGSPNASSAIYSLGLIGAFLISGDIKVRERIEEGGVCPTWFMNKLIPLLSENPEERPEDWLETQLHLKRRYEILAIKNASNMEI